MGHRDNFTASTRQSLALMVNFKCVRPSCNRLTRGPTEDLKAGINLGHAAHISAAAKNGPRYDESLTPEQRKAADNGAHLCAFCASLVDADELAYPVSLLHQWQYDAVQKARAAFVQPIRHGTVNTADMNREVRGFLRACENVRFSVESDYPQMICIMESHLSPIFQLLNECRWQYRDFDGGSSGYNWQAGDKFHAQDTHAVKIQISILQSLARIAAIIRSRNNGWYFDSNGGCYRLEGISAFGYTVFTDEHKKLIVERAKQVERLFDLYRHEILSLKNYISEGNTHSL